MNEHTAAKLDHGLAALQLAQLLSEREGGEGAPMPGEVSLADLAAFSGLSVSTIHGIERMALAKVAAGLGMGIPAHLLGLPPSALAAAGLSPDAIESLNALAMAEAVKGWDPKPDLTE